MGSAPGDGTVGVARDGGGISVTEVSSAPGLDAATSNAVGALSAASAPPAGSVVATASEFGPSTALGAPPGVVRGERVSLVTDALGGAALGAAGRMLGGGGRRPGELA